MHTCRSSLRRALLSRFRCSTDCTKAKRALQAINAQFEVIELDNTPNGSDVQAALRTITNVSSVPQASGMVARALVLALAAWPRSRAFCK
jgi:glutaredoxin